MIEWSPSRVRCYDSSTGHSSYGATLAEALNGSPRGVDVVIGVSRSSSVVRPMVVPNSSRSEVGKVLAIQLDQSLPFAPREYVYGFRLSDHTSPEGRRAIVGAMKLDSLQRILNDAKACGLRVRAIVPVAFGSWVIARASGHSEVAIVETSEGLMSVDVVQGGELVYSRSIAVPDSVAEINAEIERTFRIAACGPFPVIAVSSPDIRADIRETRPPIAHLADVGAIEKQLFSLEMPGRAEALRLRQDRWRIVRAVGAATVAISTGSFVYNTKVAKAPTSARSASMNRQMKAAKTRQAALETKFATIGAANRVLEVAFNPGQRVSDVVTVLASTASSAMWFTSVNVGHRSGVIVSGFSTNNADVAHLANDLTGDPRFREVKVVAASQTQVAKKSIFDFTISARPLGLLPFDRAMSAPKAVKGKK